MPARPWDCQLVLTVETPLEHPYRTPQQISHQTMGWKFSAGVSQVGAATIPNGVAGVPPGFQLGIIIGCYLGRAQYDFYFLPSTTGDAGKFRLAVQIWIPTKACGPISFHWQPVKDRHPREPRTTTTHTHTRTYTHTHIQNRTRTPARTGSTTRHSTA